MCTIHTTHYAQCGTHQEGHTTINHILHCSFVDKVTWTCPIGNKYVTAESERCCPKCERSLVDSSRNLRFKIDHYSAENYTPTPSSTGLSTPSADQEMLDSDDGGATPDAMEM